MAIFDLERAKKAYNKVPDYNINELMSGDNFTDFNELKVSDHRLSYELTKIRKTNGFVGNQLERIADSLENIEKTLEYGKD